MLNSIIQGDCLERMADIPDGSVDMVLCDLPYGTTACKWDTIIPFEPLWSHYKRLVKKNGAIVLTTSQPFTSALVMSNPKWFKYEWIWEKEQSHTPLNASYQPLKVHESVLVFGRMACTFSAKGTMEYHPQMEVGKPYVRGIRKDGRHQFHSKSIEVPSVKNAGTRFPRSVVRVTRETGLHPTQKPVALFEYLIKTYTLPGETVLDNCSGSGTTAIACLNTSRNYICIEKEPEYVRVSRERVAKWHADKPPLFESAAD